MADRIARIMNWRFKSVPSIPWWQSLLYAAAVVIFICLPFAVGLMELAARVVTGQWLGLP